MGFQFASLGSARLQEPTHSFLTQFEGELHLEDLQTVPEDWLQDAIRRQSPTERDLMLRHKIIAYCWMPNHTLYAVVHEDALRKARELELDIGGRVRSEVYRALIRKHAAAGALHASIRELARVKPWASAKMRISFGQTLCIAAVLLLAFAAILFGHQANLMAVASLLGCVFFVMLIGLRSLCILPLPEQVAAPGPALGDKDLPVYTVLVPLFREAAVIGQLISSLAKIDYPRRKLDIKIILEEGDRPMHAAVHELRLPPHFDVIVVPRGQPQTKPKALNYAMRFARGSLLTIYDAEDMPDPQQLRAAAARFADAEDELACLQATLDFYNPNQNWLTRQFAAEYAALFHVVLPGLAAYGLPLLLGGTSNHFRVSALNAVGAWDPYNVTEDADLGIRLARHGFKTDVLGNPTFEEANSQIGNWMKQRRRWLKGFLQTWLVHNRNPLRLVRETGLRGFITVQAMTIGIFASTLLHPLLLATTVWNFMPWQFLQDVQTWQDTLISGLSLAVLTAGFLSAIMSSAMGLRRAGTKRYPFTLATIPFYWLLVSVAAWLALWDFIVAPFHWHKTRHGLSKPRRIPISSQ
jgi:glycosyltransferase XagB